MTKGMLAAALVLIASGAMGQMAARTNGAVVVADFDDRATLDRCTIARQGGAPSVSGRLFVRFQPDQRLAADSGIDVAVATGTDGSATVSAHAITTKGTGTAGRTAAQACAVAPSPAATIAGSFRAGPSVATCSIVGEGDTATVAFSVPLATLAPDPAAKTYTGHVTLMKRGDATSGARVVAACSSATPMRVHYDIAISR